MKLEKAVEELLAAQATTKKPLSIVLAGHNGSGKSTLWYERLADTMQVPLVNADRMMLSILPERDGDHPLPSWAAKLRDENTSWMKVAQAGVEAFVKNAREHKVAFARETVFSYFKEQANGPTVSKIDDIKDLQASGYFVLLVFVGLASVDLSILRVSTRVEAGGHAVPMDRLRERFPRTRKAIAAALDVVDGALLVDNSLDEASAFTVGRVELAQKSLFDARDGGAHASMKAWLDAIRPTTP